LLDLMAELGFVGSAPKLPSLVGVRCSDAAGSTLHGAAAPLMTWKPS